MRCMDDCTCVHDLDLSLTWNSATVSTLSSEHRGPRVQHLNAPSFSTNPAQRRHAIVETGAVLPAFANHDMKLFARY